MADQAIRPSLGQQLGANLKDYFECVKAMPPYIWALSIIGTVVIVVTAMLTDNIEYLAGILIAVLAHYGGVKTREARRRDRKDDKHER